MTDRFEPRTDDTLTETVQPGARIVSSASLFGTLNEIVIDHHGAQYRLRITRQDKLILTK